jgi:hypothetical protein
MPSATMRDTSLDQNTYWLRDGLYYGRSKFLGAATPIPEGQLAKIPADDRQILIDETNADPDFGVAVGRLMSSDPDWIHTLGASAKAAIQNEIDPSKGRKGGWPLLRARVRDLVRSAAAQAVQTARSLTPEQRFAEVKRLGASARQQSPAVHGLGALGQFDIIASLVGNMATLGANIYGATVTADAQKDIAKIQASEAMQTASAQMAIANANAAIANAQNAISPVANALSTLSTSTVAGVPVLAPVLALIGLGLYLTFGKK